MATIDLTADTFETVVDDDSFVLVDFWASWCGPCRSFAPIFQSASERHTDIVFAKVDTDAEQQLAGSFGIQSIPTLAVIRNRVVLHSQAGALPETALEELIASARAVDMDEVKRELAAQGAAEQG